MKDCRQTQCALLACLFHRRHRLLALVNESANPALQAACIAAEAVNVIDDAVTGRNAEDCGGAVIANAEGCGGEGWSVLVGAKVGASLETGRWRAAPSSPTLPPPDQPAPASTAP